MHPGRMNTISRAMRNRGVEIYFPCESTWLNDRQDCYNILKNKLRIEVRLFEKIWSGLEFLRQSSHTVVASDLFKVAFIAREMIAKYENLTDAVKAAFQIVFSQELDFKKLEDEKCYRQYSSISRLTSQINLFHMFKETSYLQWAMKKFKQPSDFKRIIKFYLLSASKTDYNQFMIGDGSILESIRYCFNQIEAAYADFASDEPLDMRWSPSSICRRSFILSSTEKNNAAAFQRIAVYQLLSFTKILECSKNLEDKSLLNLAAQALNGHIPKDQLPSKTLLFLPSFFENIFFLIKDFINMDVKSSSYVLRDVWLGLLSIQNLYKICIDSIDVPVVDFWHQFKVEIKILWKFIIKRFRQVLAVSDIGIQIAEEISTRWIADSEHSRRYKCDLKVFDVCRAFSNVEEFAATKNRQSWLCFLNKNLNLMFDGLSASIKNQLMEKRRQLCSEGFTDEDPSVWFSSIYNKQNENSESMDYDGKDQKANTDHFFGLKRNVFADYVSFLSGLSKIDERNQSCDQSLFDDHLQLSLRHCGQISDNILSLDDNTLNGSTKDFLKYLNLESPIKRFMGDELFSLKLNAAGGELHLANERYKSFTNQDMFDAAIIEVENFYGAIESFIGAIRKSLPQNWTVCELKTTVRKIQNFLCSADNFVDNVAREKYLAYRDIMDPFLLGVDLLRLAFSEQLLQYLRKMKCLEIEENYSIKADELRDWAILTFLYRKTQELSQIIRLNRDANPGNSADCLKKLLNLYQNWTIENGSDDRYYEYKSKEPVNGEEQEEYHIAALFPNFMTEG
uniref:Uncharacterized protein n=1 Tax=Romanomermis culicivorax TaxID=13658 RepID=A0A915IPY0_ROMCU